MYKSQSVTLLLASNILLPIALIIFAAGFFPYKTYISGRASFDNETASRARALAPFNKVIFMVVDALRRWLPLRLKLYTSLTIPAILFTRKIQVSNTPKGA